MNEFTKVTKQLHLTHEMLCQLGLTYCNKIKHLLHSKNAKEYLIFVNKKLQGEPVLYSEISEVVGFSRLKAPDLAVTYLMDLLLETRQFQFIYHINLVAGYASDALAASTGAKSIDLKFSILKEFLLTKFNKVEQVILFNPEIFELLKLETESDTETEASKETK